jgi:predicted nucleotidyltransferase
MKSDQNGDVADLSNIDIHVNERVPLDALNDAVVESDISLVHQKYFILFWKF